MGKSKKRSRASRARSNPLGLSNKNATKNEAVNMRKIQPLLDQLQSAVPNERVMALGSITVLCEDAYMRQLFLKEKLIQIVMGRLLSDEDTEIVVESYGLLRNLSLEEGYDVSIHLWRSEVWTSINSGFDKLLKSLESPDLETKANSESTRLLFDFGDNLLSLIVALANGSDDIMENVLQPPKLNRIFEVVIAVLKHALSIKDGIVTLKCTTRLFNTVLDLIYDFSSESLEFVEAVSQDAYLSEFVQSLRSLKFTNANLLTRVLIQGIYLQFLDTNLTNDQANSIIVATCTAIEQIDMQEMLKSLSDVDQDKDVLQSKGSEVARKVKDYAKKHADGMIKLQSIEITLDIITAILEIVAAQYEETRTPLKEDLVQTLTVSIPVVFQSLSENFASRVLIAWNNMLWLYLTLDINFFELPNESWKQLWEFINSPTLSALNDFGIRLGKLGVMWALLKTIQVQPEPAKVLSVLGCNSTQFVSSIMEDFQNLDGLNDQEVSDITQRCCGILSCIALVPGQVELNRQIGRFLLQQLASSNTNAVILIAIAEVFFEIYCDAEYDYDEPVFVREEFLKILEEKVLPNMRHTFKFVDKNKNPFLKEKCQEFLRTMERFIAYKATER